MFGGARAMAQRFAAVRYVYHLAREAYTGYVRKRYPSQDIFRDKFVRNAWRSAESVSGTGSDVSQTRVIVTALPSLLRELGASSMLDVPCGDFNWMSRVDLSGVHYIGGDVVPELVRRNKQHERPNVRFVDLNLLTDRLPEADVVFCRDCLVHLSLADVSRALKNICRSRSRFLITTTFTERTENKDIPTGRWRVLNLQQAPFNFPPPEHLLVEECTEGDGAYRDKSLGVWNLDALRPLV